MEFERATEIKKLAVNANGGERLALAKQNIIKKINDVAKKGEFSLRVVFKKSEIKEEELIALDCMLDNAGYRIRRPNSSVQESETGEYVLIIQWF